MRLFPPEIELAPDEGFSKDKDIFRREELAKGLTHLVTAVEDPFVLAIDGEWGSGKTTFLRMWAGELRKAAIPVIYFDAFKNDLHEDPFIPLAGQIIALAQETRPLSDTAIETFKENSLAVGKLVLKGAAALAIRAGVRALTLGTLAAADIDETTTNLDENIDDEASDLADKILLEMLESARKKEDSVAAFKLALAQLAKTLTPPAEHETSEATELPPLVLIVDELDRCSPPFALSLLERVKHFFSVPGVHFVFGVHMPQLCTSVMSAYGHGREDAQIYLEKFIHIRVPLIDHVEHKNDHPARRYIEHIFTPLLQQQNQQGRSKELTLRFLSEYAERTNLSLRSLERLYTMIALAYAAAGNKGLMIGPLVAGLAILKLRHHDLYNKAKRGKLLYEDVATIFNFADITHTDDHHKNWERDWWRFAIQSDLPKELMESMSDYEIFSRFHDRRELLPHLCTYYFERYIPSKS